MMYREIHEIIFNSFTNFAANNDILPPPRQGKRNTLVNVAEVN